MSKFWQWALRLSKKKIMEQHLKEVGNDIKCPNCNEWFSVSGVDHKHTSHNEEFGVSTECGKCNHWSYWNLDAAPVPLLCNSQGTPL